MSSFSAPGGTLCAGAAFTFTDQSSDTPTSWSWSVTPNAGVSINSPTSQNPGISFSAPGIYTVSMKAANNSGIGFVYSKTVSIVPAPSLTVSASATTICSGDVVTFTASGASSYTWSDFGGSDSTASYNAYGASQYTVTGTSNGCSSNAVISVNASPCTGISKLLLGDDQYSVFPNPSKGKLNIKTSGNSREIVDIQITDAAGKLVFSQPLAFPSSAKTAEVNIERLAQGVYFVILSSGGEHTRALRIVKE
jgi:PKD repeat protein